MNILEAEIFGGKKDQYQVIKLTFGFFLLHYYVF